MPFMHLNRYSRLWLTLLPLCIAALSLACALPALPGRKTATPAGLAPVVTATVPPENLPPALVETDPLPGSEIPLDSPITLYFNQPMNRVSVEAAISLGGASGRFEWQDDATIRFLPDAQLLPGTSLRLAISVTAQSQRGLPLNKPVELQYQAAGALSLVQMLPDNGQQEVDPSSAIVAAFNRPVVPLGADPNSMPAAFTLEPAANGLAEWINTSTYIFYPDPPLAGGLEYTVQLNPDLKSTAGSPLQNADLAWRFQVVSPMISEVEPTEPVGMLLDSSLRLHFNQQMNPVSTAANFSMRPTGQDPINGKIEWDETYSILTFTPTSLFDRGTTYEVQVGAAAQSAGGVTLGIPFQTSRTTVANFALAGSDPVTSGTMESYETVWLTFSSPVTETGLESFFRFQPAVDDLQIAFNFDNTSLGLNGDFQPNTSYTLIIDPGLSDRYGQPLGTPTNLPFRTAPLRPRLDSTSYQSILFLTTQDTGLSIQLTNLREVPLTLDVVPLTDFQALIGPDGYTLRKNYQSDNRISWTARFELPSDRTTRCELPFNPQNEPLPPGLYRLGIGLPDEFTFSTEVLLIVSDIHLTYKISPSDVLVWAVDTRTLQPVSSVPLEVFNEKGESIVRGTTDSQGVYRSDLASTLAPYEENMVVLGQPGEALFSAAVAGWNQGLEPYTFDIRASNQGPGLKTYLYTDRPIYRPGQTMYFRAVTRFQNNGRYSLPTDLSTLPVTLYDGEGTELVHYELSLSGFATGHGEYTLLDEARPGYYRLESGSASIYFQVAAYRKPEINLQVAFNQDQVIAGEDLTAAVNARYFFDAPAGNLDLSWMLYEAPDSFTIPGYQTGLTDDRWIYGNFRGPSIGLGLPVASGSAQTNPDGSLTIELPNPAKPGSLGQATRRLTLEVTMSDESGLPVSARAVAKVHPADFFIGIRPDVWAAQAGQTVGYDVMVVDWGKNPSGSRALQAAFRKVVYERVEPPLDLPGAFPSYTPVYTEISSTDFATGPDGLARLAFSAPEPGTYELEVSGEGAHTQVLLWFGGPGQAVWPNLPNQRLRLTLDKESYQPGETAQVFVPNPFPTTATVLLTVERGIIIRHEVHSVSPGGSSLAVPLAEEDAPNVFISVTVLGEDETGRINFRQGYTNIEVNPQSLTLNITLTRQPERTGPGGEVTFNLRVTDASGNPVQGEFSLGVVDLAVLALADPNSQPIVPAFYGQQMLGVRTSLSLAGYANRLFNFTGGIGGGGGEAAAPVVREDFPDTAYWNAEIVTDANGEAAVTIALPDSLTTWQVDVRGLTADSHVGEAQTQVVTTQELLIRPVTPRFLVVGDHVNLAAIIQNNTDSNLTAQVSLQAVGVALDDLQNAAQQVLVPANGRARLEWWGTAQDVNAVDLIFSAQAGSFQDSARPALGTLPVLRYTARQAFATAGFLEGAVQQLELVSLPGGALADPASAGDLRLELAPSLAASMLTSLEALEFYPYDCTEQVLARFLPNLFLHQALQIFNIDLPEVESRLERTLQPGVTQLVARQNLDGGWGWWSSGSSGQQSSPYITAYVLFGLSQARQAGVNIASDVIERAVEYLKQVTVDPAGVNLPYQMDRLAFQQYALAVSGSANPGEARLLYGQKDQLSPWAQALLALTLETGSPGSPEAADLLAVLQVSAQRSATGAFWSDPSPRWQNLNTTVTTTAMVVYALAKLEPASTLLPEAVRFIMASRGAEGSWQSTYETTWALLAATAYMQGTGEVGGDYDFRATLNSSPLASGQAGGDTRLTPVIASAPVSSLYPADPNALRIERSAGPGRLYYTALLDVAFPADQAAPLNRGLSVERVYLDPANCSRERCPVIQSAPTGTPLTVHITLVVPQDAYYVVVEDFIPAGSEILDRSLKTSQLGDPTFEETTVSPLYDPEDPFADGWGWWLFSSPAIFDDHIAWSADYLPPGTYELVYNLTALQAGEFRLMPARAYQFYFPEVQGSSAGGVFTIQP